MLLRSLLSRMAKLGYFPDDQERIQFSTPHAWLWPCTMNKETGKIAELSVVRRETGSNLVYTTLDDAIKKFLRCVIGIPLDGPWDLSLKRIYMDRHVLYELAIFGIDFPFQLKNHEMPQELKGIIRQCMDTGERADEVILDYLKEHYPELDRFELEKGETE